MRNAYKILIGKYEEEGNLVDLGEDGKIILN
jgi:hypothetical protein